jgi:integrase
LRSGELIALRFEDVGYARSRVNIRRTRRHGIENAPKTKASHREVFISPDVAESLQTLQEKRNAAKSDYVFLAQYSQPYDDIPHEPWKQAVERAGVDYRRCYTLRHSHASWALSNNVRLSYVSAALGHTSVNVTAQKYIRYLPDVNEADEKKLIKLSERAGSKLSVSRPQSDPLEKKRS